MSTTKRIKLDEALLNLPADTLNQELEIKHLGNRNLKIDEIIHISDIHIKAENDIAGIKMEYNDVFNNLFKMIRSRKLERPHRNMAIVITGDLVHVKLKIEPGSIIMARKFMKELTDIAPTVLIIGNHDFAKNNPEQDDFMTALSLDIDIHCLKYTGLYQLGNVIFSFSSLFDNKFIYRTQIQNLNGLPIYKLYHGTVYGSHNFNGTQNKWVSTGPTDKYYSVKDFNGYDAVLLGHIHKYQQLNNHIAYAGSLIQQNFGESIEGHGFLVWDTATHMPTFLPVENKYVYLNLEVNNGTIEKASSKSLDDYKYKKLRIKCKLSQTTNEQYTTVKKMLLESYDVVFIKKELVHTSFINQFNKSSDRESIELEYELIEKYMDPKFQKEKMFNLHKNYRADLKSEVNITSSPWCLVKMVFKNTMFYGGNHVNEIDFISGVYSLCSPNKTGKSTIINLIIYALFETNPTNIVHEGENEAFIKLTFKHMEQLYQIEKEFYQKSKKTKLKFNFYRVNEHEPNELLNGADNKLTSKNIEKLIGGKHEFISHQIISNRIGECVLMKQKAEVSSHFLKLCHISFFEKTVKQSKDDSSKLEKQLNRVEGELKGLNSGLDGKLDEFRKQLLDLELKKKKDTECLDSLKSKYIYLKEEKNKLREQVKNNKPTNVILNLLESLTYDKDGYALVHQTDINKIINFIKEHTFEEEKEESNFELTENKKEKQKVAEEIRKLNESISQNEYKINSQKENIRTLEQKTNKINQLNLEKMDLNERVNYHKEYQKLFHANKIPSEIMKRKLLMLNEEVNQIFNRYTCYSFEMKMNNKGKPEFTIKQNKNNKMCINVDQLSGFEWVVLRIAFNYGVLRIINYKCDFIAIDESLDCLDEENFNKNLPEIIDVLKECYTSILLISHRDLPSSIIDKKIKICCYDMNYSRINS